MAMSRRIFTLSLLASPATRTPQLAGTDPSAWVTPGRSLTVIREAMGSAAGQATWFKQEGAETKGKRVGECILQRRLQHAVALAMNNVLPAGVDPEQAGILSGMLVARKPPGGGCRSTFTAGGAEGTRTPDPHTASVVRYQLRHGPARPPQQALAQYYTARTGTRASAFRAPREDHRQRAPQKQEDQFSVGSDGKKATAACMPPWRRSTIDHRSSGRSVNASPGRALNVNHEPVAISSSS